MEKEFFKNIIRVNQYFSLNILEILKISKANEKIKVGNIY